MDKLEFLEITHNLPKVPEKIASHGVRAVLIFLFSLVEKLARDF